MIDVSKLQAMDTTVDVIPSDKIFEELGNNTYNFQDLISELIDNSLAARFPGRVLHVEVEIFVDHSKEPEGQSSTGCARG